MGVTKPLRYLSREYKVPTNKKEIKESAVNAANSVIKNLEFLKKAEQNNDQKEMSKLERDVGNQVHILYILANNLKNWRKRSGLSIISDALSAYQNYLSELLKQNPGFGLDPSKDWTDLNKYFI